MFLFRRQRFHWHSHRTACINRTKQWSQSSSRPGDPPLSKLGHQQARETGAFLDQLLSNDGITLQQVTWLSSPFLRCLQTSDAAIDSLHKIVTPDDKPSEFRILPEYSVFEWDGHGGKWHESLPALEERVHYFPRLQVHHPSLFVPTIPEPRSEFLHRCQRAVQCLNETYSSNPAIVVVTHAAACIGLCRAATASNTWEDITPAAPCSVYRLSRKVGEDVWTLDAHDAPNSLNGHTSHLTELGTTTKPWNNFGDKKVNKGYTGPPTSRFAPK